MSYGAILLDPQPLEVGDDTALERCAAVGLELVEP